MTIRLTFFFEQKKCFKRVIIDPIYGFITWDTLGVLGLSTSWHRIFAKHTIWTKQVLNPQIWSSLKLQPTHHTHDLDWRLQEPLFTLKFYQHYIVIYLFIFILEGVKLCLYCPPNVSIFYFSQIPHSFFTYFNIFYLGWPVLPGQLT